MRSISDLDNFSFGTYLAGYVLQRLLVHDVLIMFSVYFWEVYISKQWAMAENENLSCNWLICKFGRTMVGLLSTMWNVFCALCECKVKILTRGGVKS